MEDFPSQFLQPKAISNPGVCARCWTISIWQGKEYAFQSTLFHHISNKYIDFYSIPMLNQRSARWGLSVQRMFHDVQQPALKKLTAMNYQFRLSLSINWKVPECRPHTGQQHVLTVSYWNVSTEITAIYPSHWSRIYTWFLTISQDAGSHLSRVAISELPGSELTLWVNTHCQRRYLSHSNRDTANDRAQRSHQCYTTLAIVV